MMRKRNLFLPGFILPVAAMFLFTILRAGAQQLLDQPPSVTEASGDTLQKAPEGISSEFRRPLHMNLAVGYKRSEWDPANFRAWRRDLYEPETVVLENYNVNVLLSWDIWPFAFYRQEWPAGSSPEQEEAFEVNHSNESALKKIDVGVVFSWIPGLQGNERWWARAIRGTTYTHTEETYFGRANAVGSFAFVPLDAAVEFYGDQAGNVESSMIQQGDTLGFRTSFKGDEIIMPFSFTLPLYSETHAADAAQRRKTPEWMNVHCTAILLLGAYQVQWERPSDMDERWRLTEGNVPMILETDFSSRGLLWGAMVECTYHAWKISASMRQAIGLDDEVTSAFSDMYPAADQYYKSLFSALGVEYAIQEPGAGWATSIQCGVVSDIRFFYKEGTGPGSDEGEAEELTRYFVSISCQL